MTDILTIAAGINVVFFGLMAWFTAMRPGAAECNKCVAITLAMLALNAVALNAALIAARGGQ